MTGNGAPPVGRADVVGGRVDPVAPAVVVAAVEVEEVPDVVVDVVVGAVVVLVHVGSVVVLDEVVGMVVVAPHPGSCHCCPASQVPSLARTSHWPPHASDGMTPRVTVTGTQGDALGMVVR